MADFSSLQQKVNALKAKVEQSSITPTYLGSILDDFITQMKSIDMTGMSADIQAAVSNATAALQKANQALTASRNAIVTADAAKAITDTKGLPGGLASLDSGGKVPASQLPGYVDDVVEFNAMVSGVTSQMASAAHKSTDAGCMVVYDTDNNVFLLAVSKVEVIDQTQWGSVKRLIRSVNASTSAVDADEIHQQIKLGDFWQMENGSASLIFDQFTYYNNWLDGDSFGDETLNGREPEDGKIYTCTSDNKTFRWSGSQLITIGSDLALGRTASTAFPGDAGASMEETVSDHDARLTDHSAKIAENTLMRDTLLPLDALVDVPASSSLFTDGLSLAVDKVVWNTATKRLWGWNPETNHYYSSWPTWQKYGTKSGTGAKGVIPAANRIFYDTANCSILYVKSPTAGLAQLHEAAVNRTLANYNQLQSHARRLTAVEEVAEQGRAMANAVQEDTKGTRFININTFTDMDEAFSSLSEALECVPDDYRWQYGTVVTFLYEGMWVVNGKQKRVRKWLSYQWTATDNDEDADWLHTDEWEQLPDRDDIITVNNRLTGTQERVDALRPLPFVFGTTADDSASDVAVYFRDEMKFYRLGEVIAPEELGYNNEDPETGEVTASTRRQFICGNRLYRFTGLDFVDVAVERCPERRLVRKTPSINSHPGLVYINKNIIRLPFRSNSAGTVDRISLEGMYWQEGNRLVPLSELEVRYDPAILSVERDGGSLVVTRVAGGYKAVSATSLSLKVGEIGGPYLRPGIGVRYDGSGRKVFYECGQVAFASAARQEAVERDLEYVRTGCVAEGDGCLKVRCINKLGLQVQLWEKTARRRNGKRKFRWHWRKGNDVWREVHRDHCLVRVRRKHGGRNGIWSEWGYVHVSRMIGGIPRVRWSVQARK